MILKIGMSVLIKLFTKNWRLVSNSSIRPKIKVPITGFSIPIRLITTMDETDPNYKVISKKHTRFMKRQMKRPWEESKVEDNNESEEKKAKPLTERIKKKKIVMLLGYCGADYNGMQRNPGVRTIEEDLFKAMMEANYITEMDFNNQHNTQFQRCSRTDKGVSAARQIVSMKLPLDVSIEEINKRLPECIKVFAIKRVTKGFNSKGKCNARTYSYTFPTYVLETSLESVEDRLQYRISPEKLEKLKSVLSIYKGNKNYHNFTEKKHFIDPSSLRYMMGFTVEKVFVESDMEFAELMVKGQSFMMHQIRKMVGLAIAILRDHTDMSIMEKVFTKEKVAIPKAPGLGLMLETAHFERYDSRYKNTHDSLTWESEEEAIQKFKHEHIYPHIIRGETEENNMGLWLEKLNKHSYVPSDNVQENDEDAQSEALGDDDENNEGNNGEVELEKGAIVGVDNVTSVDANTEQNDRKNTDDIKSKQNSEKQEGALDDDDDCIKDENRMDDKDEVELEKVANSATTVGVK